jgi:hypothetical protein
MSKKDSAEKTIRNIAANEIGSRLSSDQRENVLSKLGHGDRDL